VLRVGGLEIDRVRHEVRVDGRLVELTPSEFRLLALLASEPGRAFTRRELVRELWRSDYVGDERICDTHVVGLRRKVEPDPARPARVLAVRGVGYKLVAA
jgi:DNA-binding response OmpR family regulator